MIQTNSIKPLFYSCKSPKLGLAHSKLIVKHAYSEEIQAQKKHSFTKATLDKTNLKILVCYGRHKKISKLSLEVIFRMYKIIFSAKQFNNYTKLVYITKV